MIQKEKIKQENYEKNIDSVNADIEQLQEIKFLAKSRIKDYKPYEVGIFVNNRSILK